MDRSLAQLEELEEQQSKHRHLQTSSRSSELGGSVYDDHDNDDLKRTYKKALCDYSTLSQEMEKHNMLADNNVAHLRSKLDEKEEKASLPPRQPVAAPVNANTELAAKVKSALGVEKA